MKALRKSASKTFWTSRKQKSGTWAENLSSRPDASCCAYLADSNFAQAALWIRGDKKKTIIIIKRKNGTINVVAGCETTQDRDVARIIQVGARIQVFIHTHASSTGRLGTISIEQHERILIIITMLLTFIVVIHIRIYIYYICINNKNIFAKTCLMWRAR